MYWPQKKNVEHKNNTYAQKVQRNEWIKVIFGKNA